MSYARQHLDEARRVIDRLDAEAIERVADVLHAIRERGGRLFFLGVGGSAANCSHAVNDFRKIAGFEAYAPTDNVSELTARTNDEGTRARPSGTRRRSGRGCARPRRPRRAVVRTRARGASARRAAPRPRR